MTKEKRVEFFGRNFNNYCSRSAITNNGRTAIYVTAYDTIECRLFKGVTTYEEFTKYYKNFCKLFEYSLKIYNNLTKF